MSEITEQYIEYEYIGDGRYVIPIPARDLTPADLVELEEREGVTREQIEETGLYERVEWQETKPFCGAEKKDGTRCRRPVAAWGERCYQHQEVKDVTGTESI